VDRNAQDDQRSASPARWCWWMPATVMTPSCVRALRSWTHLCGRHSAANLGVEAGVRPGRAPRRGAATHPIRPRSRTSPSGCVRERGAPSNGGKAPMNGYRRGLRVCVSCGIEPRALRKSSKEWLLIGAPRARIAPTKYWLSTLPKTSRSRDFGRRAKLGAHRTRL